MTETILDAPAETRTRQRVGATVPCVLAWLVPGLGHLWLGRTGRAIAFFAIVAATFVLGITSGGASTVVDGQQPLSYLAVVDNLAIGPLDLVARRLTLGELVYRLPDAEADPRRQEIMGRVRDRVRIPTYEYGSTFLLTAGLMNILLILDAFDIASGRKD
jgi:uncharacterized protein DUF6677